MGDYSFVRGLLEQGAYREAADAIDASIRTASEDHYLWYLRGVVSLKLKNYEYAHECFHRAISIHPKPLYYKMNGVAHLEQFELPEAIDSLHRAENDQDSAVYVFLAIAHLLSDTPGAGAYLKKAYHINKAKTSQLLSHFYEVFFKPNPFIDMQTKSLIEARLSALAVQKPRHF